MKSNSLRTRLLLFAVVAVVFGLVASGFGLVSLFGRHVERRIGAELDAHLTHLVGNLRSTSDGRLSIDRLPSDARFTQIHSGRYWQVTDEKRNEFVRSRSLWDAVLPVPADRPDPGKIDRHIVNGPDNIPVFVHEQLVIKTIGGAERQVRILAGMNVSEIEALKAGFARDLIPALLLLGALLLGGLWIQVTAGLRPIEVVREGINAIRSGQAEKLPGEAAPEEIAGLVGELNSLLDAQDKAIIRARDRAADMAHGLKTPLAALAGDVRRLRESGNSDIASSIESIAVQMRRTVERELARSRLRGQQRGMRPQNLADAVNQIAATLQKTPGGEGKEYVVKVPESFAALVDRDDLNDIFGNLMDNATRFARKTVAVSAVQSNGAIAVTVDDDGIGPDISEMNQMVERGARLDNDGSSGLGLAITSEILREYGSTLEFDLSLLGGLKVRFVLPSA